ncbi:EamA family transporter RarD [Solirubrobacter sp. CPCC 204708]|uniref:EamA family transporter RarD n=1 Tax=Solirubrobacter deserti TaxID=2282478 RepID=A0ABT4RH63_9ACTN|nr:EamA family transporter RarD [Solirubrobacter deserti]MBE2319596.1 EamA family transporter RarD [Solirubrobacter deserti]MDA0137665.1 EamA family transporter RarD [Solirubrobacter deserti]
MTAALTRSRSGFLAGLAAYLLWGLFPLYWPLLKPAGAIEILAHRIVWSVVLLVAILALTHGFRWARELDRKRVLLLGLAAVLITVNWGAFIYGVNSDHVVETSLGYFINPLVTVALAVSVVGEKLRRAQWAAVVIAGVAVAVLTVAYGRPPWIALTLAFSFGFYGLVKKQVGLEGTQSLAVETAFLTVPALLVVLWFAGSGEGTFGHEGVGHALLMIGGGVATAVPLMLFGAAAIRVPLTTIGLLQYLAPIMQFLIGVLVYGEHMPLERWLGFTLVWLAVIVFTADSVRARARRPAMT